MKNRLFYMDILRFIAVFLVMFAHFVSVGTFATKIPTVINDLNSGSLPLFKQDDWSLWIFDSKLIELFNTQAGIVGVLIFFLITGYLITTMQDRYSRNQFIINRIFRIFPALIFCTLLVGCFLFFTQNIKLHFLNYISSITLTYSFLAVEPLMGVLWTLIVEVLFYIIAFLIGRFNKSNLLFLQTALLMVVYQSTVVNNDYLNLIATNSKYILFILIGVAIKIVESEKKYFCKLTVLASSIFFAYLSFRIYKFGHGDETTYRNIGSHLLALAIFLLFYTTQKWTLVMFRKIPTLFYKIVDLTYPLYLLHVAIGLGSVFFIRNYFDNQYVILAIAIMICVIFSLFIHFAIEKPGISLGRFLIKKYLSN